ncbi:PREDICTED: carcinoembryonic antigen-related cell adhesion molecule 19 [Propithecus coquereli]|uniref:carcinoembryonic antigen-related cell adhesion molecule 19 n=1 Tax=Propithecus coquereli TaxID=379532 RepID=UPI00063F9FC7|nr:PREDICTED: carcinoembryonic antigen-related cell adhesion molecule 19 [Propithecus coquereli]
MKIPTRTQGHFSKSLLLSALILALWRPQGSQAALHIQKIPERPQKNQDLLLSVQGVPDTFQDINWYLGEEAYGGTRLFTYIPELQRPQRDGSAMKQRDIVGFPNGSMLLRRAQPTDSGTYQVAITINPAWTMKAKTEVQVAEKHKDLPGAHLPMNAGIVATIIIGSLAAGALLIGSIACLLVTRSWRGQSHRYRAPGLSFLCLLLLLSSQVPLNLPQITSSNWTTTTENPDRGPSHSAGNNNAYELMSSPAFPVSPLSDKGSTNSALVSPSPPSLQPGPENHQYQDLLNPDPAPYCQLVPSPEGARPGQPKTRPLPAPGGLAPMTEKTLPRPAGQGHQGLRG